MCNLRKEKTREDVAKSIGVSLSAYTKYERDERVPRDEIKKKIAIFFGVGVADIFFAN